MTLVSRLVFFKDEKKTPKQSSEKIELNEISIVIPVKDNKSGVDRYLSTFLETHHADSYPKEIIIVDNNSKEPIDISRWRDATTLPITVVHCARIGPAAARNVGAGIAKGKWLLFNDSDCIPTPSLLTGYLSVDNGSVSYAGNVKSYGQDVLSQYYETQEILIPLKVIDEIRGHVPQYLITANCLIWKQAFMGINGFNEGITIASGEDVDLGLRLSRIGNLSYSFDSVVMHNFNDGLAGFYRRFVRYGNGNKIIEQMWNVDMRPKPFKPNTYTHTNIVLATLQFLCLFVGYRKASRSMNSARPTNSNSHNA